MLAFIAALLAAVAAILSGLQVNTSPWFTWHTLLCAAVACLALWLAGVGRGTPWRQAPPAA